MKAVLVGNNRELIYTDVPNPVCGDEDVIVKIEAAALNRADLMQREGNYPPPAGCPEWMGLEIAGTIVQMGKDVEKLSKWKTGDKVCALLGGGGYAQYANVKYDMLMPIPNGLSAVEAAALPEAYATSYLNLFIEGRIKKGDTFLMLAGASGLGTVAIPMAKAFGIKVIATVRSDEKAEACKKMGADIVVNTKKENLIDVLDANPVDVAIDCVGGSEVGKYLEHLNHGARWIMIAALAGTQTEIDLRNVYKRNVRLIGSTLRSRKPEYKAEILATLVKEVWPLVEAGKIKPEIYKVLPIEKAEEAHQILYKGENIGKVVLTVD